MTYRYDHLAKKLLKDHAWARVPWFIPIRDENKKDGHNLISKINELEERIVNGHKHKS